jgi:hypothetical protein
MAFLPAATVIVSTLSSGSFPELIPDEEVVPLAKTVVKREDGRTEALDSGRS